MTILVTGAAGFIGGNFVLDWLAQGDEPVINLDKLTYAGNLDTLKSLDGDARHIFVKGSIGDFDLVSKLLLESMTPKMESRALAVQGMLAERGFHRAAKVPDLLIAAVAEMSGYTVLHVDRDFELIAEVTGQPIERLSMPS